MRDWKLTVREYVLDLTKRPLNKHHTDRIITDSLIIQITLIVDQIQLVEDLQVGIIQS